MKLLLALFAVLAVLQGAGAVRRRLIVRQNGKVVNEIDHANFDRTCEINGLCTYNLTAPAFDQATFEAVNGEVVKVQTNETVVQDQSNAIKSKWDGASASYEEKAKTIRTRLDIVNAQIIALRAKLANISNTQKSINQTNVLISNSIGALPQCYKNALVTCATTTTVGPGTVATTTTAVPIPSDNSTNPTGLSTTSGPTSPSDSTDSTGSTVTLPTLPTDATDATKPTSSDSTDSTETVPSEAPVTSNTDDGGSDTTVTPTEPASSPESGDGSSTTEASPTEGSGRDDDSYF